MTDYYFMVDGVQFDGFTAESADDYNIEDLIDEHMDEIESLPDFPNVKIWIDDEYGNVYQDGYLGSAEKGLSVLS